MGYEAANQPILWNLLIGKTVYIHNILNPHAPIKDTIIGTKE